MVLKSLVSYKSRKYLIRRCPSKDVLIKSNKFSLVIHLQDVFKTSSSRFAKTSSRHLQDIFKTSSRHLQDVLQSCLQDVFKMYFQVKLFLVTQFQDVFQTFSKCFWEMLQRQLSTGGLPRSYIWEIMVSVQRMIKVSQVLVLHFTAPFSGCLQRRILNLLEHLQCSFFFAKMPNGVSC